MSRTLYTAVGRFEKQYEPDGEACPTIWLGQKEYGVDLQELMVWSSLNWRLLSHDKIGVYYTDLAQSAQYECSRTWQDCLDRLLLRGLVVAGHGETDYDALYDLLAPLNIITTGGNLFTRLLSFLKLTVWDGVSIRAAKKVFAVDRRNSCEKQVMRLVSKTFLSTAEVIRCIELGILSLPSMDYLIEHLYHDADTTSDNIPYLVKASSSARPVILAVANLYLRQQLIFDRV